VTVAAWTEGPAVVIEVRWRHAAVPDATPHGLQGDEASVRARDGVLRAEKHAPPPGERFRALSRG
jgi:hypothetical protein